MRASAVADDVVAGTSAPPAQPVRQGLGVRADSPHPPVSLGWGRVPPHLPASPGGGATRVTWLAKVDGGLALVRMPTVARHHGVLSMLWEYAYANPEGVRVALDTGDTVVFE